MADETDNPQSTWDLSRHRYQEALDRVEAGLRGDPVPGGVDLFNEMRIIRLVSMHRAPWYGASVDHEDNSVTVGVMMRNAFEALGEFIDEPNPKIGHWFTRRYLPLWRQGKREYLEWLDTLGQERPPESRAGR
jgi:hypothetical protein